VLLQGQLRLFLRTASAKMMRDGDVMMEAGKEELERQAFTPQEQAVLSVGFTDTDYATNSLCFSNETNTSATSIQTLGERAVVAPTSRTPAVHAGAETAHASLRIHSISLKRPPAVRGSLPSKLAGVFSFQFHLGHEIKATWGSMIQVQGKNGLDNRQKIETEMTQQVCVKIFRTMTTSEDVTRDRLTALEEAIKDGYKKRLQKPLHGGDPAALGQTLPGLTSSAQTFEAHTARF